MRKYDCVDRTLAIFIYVYGRPAGGALSSLVATFATSLIILVTSLLLTGTHQIIFHVTAVPITDLY